MVFLLAACGSDTVDPDELADAAGAADAAETADAAGQACGTATITSDIAISGGSTFDADRAVFQAGVPLPQFAAIMMGGPTLTCGQAADQQLTLMFPCGDFGPGTYEVRSVSAECGVEPHVAVVYSEGDDYQFGATGTATVTETSDCVRADFDIELEGGATASGSVSASPCE